MKLVYFGIGLGLGLILAGKIYYGIGFQDSEMSFGKCWLKYYQGPCCKCLDK